MLTTAACPEASRKRRPSAAMIQQPSPREAIGKVFLKLRGKSPLLMGMTCPGKDCSRVGRFSMAAKCIFCNESPERGGDTGRGSLCYACAASFDDDANTFRQIHKSAEAHVTGPSGGLVRTIGRWSLAALMVNTMIGASIFGLPSLLAARLGRYSPAAYLFAAAGIGVIAACLAEVASQFREAGGPYLYARVAFGQFAAIQIGWLTWLTRIVSAAALTNLFISYLGEFFPLVNAPVMRAAVMAVLIGFLAAVNYRGVSGGNQLSNFFTVTKLVLLLVFTGGGLISLLLQPSIRVIPAQISPTGAAWSEAIILMVWAYAGFEAAFIAAGEARNPRKDGPVALFIAIGTATLLYIAVQYLVIHILPDAASSTR